jgi:hypothetical protein
MMKKIGSSLFRVGRGETEAQLWIAVDCERRDMSGDATSAQEGGPDCG